MVILEATASCQAEVHLNLAASRMLEARLLTSQMPQLLRWLVLPDAVLASGLQCRPQPEHCLC